MSLRVGILVNPIAGIGGQAAFKGSDHDWKRALDEGFQPVAPARARRFVDAVLRQADADVQWLTPPGAMGVEGVPTLPADAGGVLGKQVGDTSAEDTMACARALRDAGVDLLCFVGGDGTAADVARAVDQDVPCLGVPGGVKITSPVYAHDLDEAAWLVTHLEPGFDTIARDVTDLVEQAYRDGRVEVELRGSLLVPASPLVQGGKVPTTADTPLEGIVEQALQGWDPDALHVIGAGSVCRALKERFWGEPTLLGVDVVKGDRILESDVDARRLSALVEAHDGSVELWLSLIGGQGMLLGRGTQVLAPAVLWRVGWDRIHVIAPPEKLFGLRGVHVDSGDPDFDAQAPAFVRVIAGHRETRMVRVLHGVQHPHLR